MQTIYLVGGCFWGVQKYIDQFPGVVEEFLLRGRVPPEIPGQESRWVLPYSPQVLFPGKGRPCPAHRGKG